MLRWAAPAALLAVFFLQSFLASRVKSPTFDEPAHIAAGLSYLSTGVFHANPQHPPLMKELSAVGMLLGGVRWPKTAIAADIVANPSGKSTARDWDAGKEIFAAYGMDRVLLLARLPMILTGVFLGLMLYLWGREMLGETAALGALFLFALNPTIVAHAALVTTDVGLAAFAVAFFFALWKHMQAPSLARQIWCGVALGCALGAKYSGVFLLPIGGVLLLFGALRRRTPAVRAAAPNQACPCGSGKKYKACHGAQPTGSGIDTQAVAAAARAFGVMCLVALVTIEIFYGFRVSPLEYVDGLRRVNADHDPNYMAILAGEAKPRFLHYFALAWLLKEPLATLLLCAAGAILLLRLKLAPVGAKAFLLLPPLAILAIHSFWADNFGFRYIIPALPFAYLAGGIAIAWLVGKAAAWARVAAVVLCGWVVVAAAGIYPDHLSYMNESACALADPSRMGFDGGSRCGPMWLDESNVDWGQGLRQLKTWLDAHAQGRAVHILHHGTILPEAYGIQHTPPPPSPGPTPALYVISGHYVARLALTEERVRSERPLAIVGHAFYVYEF
jgi:hypothetical protein